MSERWLPGAAAALLIRPRLWATAGRQIVRLAQRTTVEDPVSELEEMLATDIYDQPAAD